MALTDCCALRNEAPRTLLGTLAKLYAEVLSTSSLNATTLPIKASKPVISPGSNLVGFKPKA